MIPVQEMQRQIVAFGFEEARNRALEEAACEVENRAKNWRGADRYDAELHARAIRSLKRNPEDKLSDWWSPSNNGVTL